VGKRVDPVTKYARAVSRGKIVAGRPVRLACQRHLNDLKRKDIVWRADLAQMAIDFYEEILLLEDGAPFLLQPFQKFIVGSLIGWLRIDGTRRFRTAYIETAKGTGKTPLAAGLGLYCLVADNEPAAEIYSAAVTKDQARLVWSDAERMVQASEELSELVMCNVNLLHIPGDRSVFRPISSEHRGLDGKRVHVALIDEIQEHPNGNVVAKIRAGVKSRRQPLIVEITNSGYGRTSICWQHHDLSIKVLEGVFEKDEWFAYVCALDEGDNWLDEKVWPKANPGLGTILPWDYMRQMVSDALAMPAQENIVKRLNFCMWTEQSVRWLNMEAWQKCGQPFDVEELRGRKCYGGLDLAKVHDLSALALVFPPIDDDELLKVLVFFWIPDVDMTVRSQQDFVPYDVWVRDGLIRATEGNVTDFESIEADVIELAGIYDIQEIAYDRTFAGEIVQGLMRENITMVEMGQGFLSMGAPTAELERMVKGQKFSHNGNKVLYWNASNVTVSTNAAGDIKPDKEKSTERIDGIVALIMAVDKYMRNETSTSVYEQRGILSA
jgi:phage terminase large subunit-like protein